MQQDRPERTTIAISPTVKDELDKLGAKNDSYEDIIVRLVECWKVTQTKVS